MVIQIKKMKKQFKIILVIIMAGSLAHMTPALADMTPGKILKKADEARGNVEGIEWEIDIESVERGRRQNRIVRVKARDVNSLAEFISPPKVKGRKLVMLDRNMWFTKPGLRKPVPISPRQKLIGGTSNGDIASTNYAGDYKVAHASRDIVDEEPCHFFDLTAMNKKVTYDRIKYWISEKRLVGIKAEFFTVSGKLLKSATMEYGNSIMIKGKPHAFISKMVITNALVEDDVTTMTYSKAKIKKIPDSAFNLNLLVR